MAENETLKIVYEVAFGNIRIDVAEGAIEYVYISSVNNAYFFAYNREEDIFISHSSEKGEDGADGKSAYEIWLEQRKYRN